MKKTYTQYIEKPWRSNNHRALVVIYNNINISPSNTPPPSSSPSLSLSLSLSLTLSLLWVTISFLFYSLSPTYLFLIVTFSHSLSPLFLSVCQSFFLCPNITISNLISLAQCLCFFLSLYYISFTISLRLSPPLSLSFTACLSVCLETPLYFTYLCRSTIKVPFGVTSTFLPQKESRGAMEPWKS